MIMDRFQALDLALDLGQLGANLETFSRDWVLEDCFQCRSAISSKLCSYFGHQNFTI